MTTVIPVLLYHSVSDDTATDSGWGRVPVSTFAAHVSVIRSSGRRPVSVTALAAALRGQRSLPDRAVAVTFDDGYADNVAAVEMLCAHDLGATVYVTTGRIGTRGRLTPRQLVGLSRMPGVQIGSHGVSHRRLDELPSAQVHAELSLSRVTLEQVISAEVSSFAYPHGAYGRDARAAVGTAGYCSAVAVKNALSHAGDDPLAIARFTVTAGVEPRLLEQLLEGGAAPLAWSGERLRTRAHRLARRQRRRLLSVRRGA